MRNKYRSLLFVPATQKLLPKIETTTADAIIVDLEDAILETDKDSALDLLCGFLSRYSYRTDIYVRVNPSRVSIELPRLNEFPIKGYMLPKSENAIMIHAFHELAPGKEIIALIETAIGMVSLKQIAFDENVSMLAFGAEDYTTQCGIKNENEFLAYPKSMIVAHSKACGKMAIDTISLNITEPEAYEAEARKSKDYGFDGKLAIHPMQVEIINRVFIDDIEYYKRIVSEYEKCGEGILRLDGEVFEKPHIEAMKRRIKDYED